MLVPCLTAEEFVRAYIEECVRDPKEMRNLTRAADARYGKKKRKRKREKGKPAVVIPEAEYRKLRVDQGLTRKQIADMYSTTDNVIKNHDVRYGIKMRKIKKTTPAELFTVRKLFIDKGMTAKEVAEELGESQSRIEHMLKFYGIRKRGY